MALPVIVAGAARGLAAAGRGLAKGARGAGRRVGEAARRRPSIAAPPTKAEEEAPEDEATRKTSALLSTEGLTWLPMAILLDIFGIICLILNIFFGAGEILSWISDGIGIIFINGWMLFRSGKVVETPSRTKGGLFRFDFLRKLFRGKYKRFLTPILGEVAPFVGALPFWSLAVYFELTD